MDDDYDESRLRIDDEDSDDNPSSPKHQDSHKNGEEKRNDAAKKKETPDSKTASLNYLSSGSSINRAKKDIYMSIDDDNLEEGEIQEPMIKNFFTSSLPQSAPKKRKAQVEMVDASTCVTDDSLSDDVSLMKQNHYYMINIMILSRSATTTGHTFTFTTNFRGTTYHGILTDGSPPIIHNNQIQKRAAAAEKEKTAEDSDEKREVTPKPRGPKRSRGDDDSKSPAKTKHRHKSPQLREVLSDDYFRCPHKQCGFRFLAMGDVNNHMVNSHVEGMAVVKDEIATQTDAEECHKCRKLEQELIEERSISALFKNTKKDKTLKKEKSPVSDDDAAPTLQKETYTGNDKDPAAKSSVASVTALSPSLEPMARVSRLPTIPSISQKPDPHQLIRPDIVPIPAASLAAPFPGFPVASGLPQMFFNSPFNANFANNSLLQQAAVAASTANATKPAMPFGAPPPGFPANGLSPVPSSSKMSGDQNRHKIHELKTEGQVTPAPISSSTAIPGRSITAGTSGNPMDLLSLRPMQRLPGVSQAQPTPGAAPLNLLQQQMMLQRMFPGDLNQFSYLSNQTPGLFQPPK